MIVLWKGGGWALTSMGGICCARGRRAEAQEGGRAGWKGVGICRPRGILLWAGRGSSHDTYCLPEGWARSASCNGRRGPGRVRTARPAWTCLPQGSQTCPVCLVLSPKVNPPPWEGNLCNVVMFVRVQSRFKNDFWHLSSTLSAELTAFPLSSSNLLPFDL